MRVKFQVYVYMIGIEIYIEVGTYANFYVILAQPSPQTCPNQELSYRVTVEERGHETRVIYSSGPLVHNSRQPAEHEISSPNLKRRRIFVMNFTVSTGFESSTKLQEFGKSMQC